MADLLTKAEQGVNAWLTEAKDQGKIDQGSFEQAKEQTIPNLRDWLTDEHIPTFSPAFREGVTKVIEQENWEAIVNAYRQYIRFGTGGIRGMMGFDKPSIEALQRDGFEAPILKGPNTINEILLLRTSAGVAQFGKASGRSFNKIVIGYDSRIRGRDFAAIVAQLFLAYGYTIYFFDEPCPYPEVTFAIPSETIKADIGILISASHNDYRYNGYKLSCGNGSQFDPKERNEMYEDHIVKAKFSDIKLCPFADAKPGKLISLGGESRAASLDSAGFSDHINIHAKHRAHMISFLYEEKLKQQKDDPNGLQIAFCPYHGAGKVAVPKMLEEAGFSTPKMISGENNLDEINGLFPSFRSDPGKEQQPDPGDPRAATKAIEAFNQDYPGQFDNIDILIGTDPDADRCGVVVKVPEAQREVYDSDTVLLPADEMWALLNWYRLHRSAEQNGGNIPDADKQFIVFSHTTSEVLSALATKYGLGVVKTWVGFAALSAAVRDAWNKVELPALTHGRTSESDEFCHPFICEHTGMDNGKRSINAAAMEQSNGFSILGGPPPDAFSLGENGHVRDKDGTFAALLTAEVAAWAKMQGKSIIDLIDENIYLDPDVGLFVTGYEPDPLDGEYPGIAGDRKKIDILKRALANYEEAKNGTLELAGMPVKSACIYRTGKYDKIYPPTPEFEFPDEGIRFFLSDDQLSHFTVRPSGTGNSLRFHVQLHSKVTKDNIVAEKARLRKKCQELIDYIRVILKAERE